MAKPIEFDGTNSDDGAQEQHSGQSSMRQGIQSIEVGGRLLEVLAGASRAMMLRDLAARAEMSPAKAHRYLVSFIRMGLVEQDPDSGRYDLGQFALTLGLAALNRLDPLQLARPALTQLNLELDQTVSVAVWGNHGPTVVQWLDSSHAITVNLRAGAVMPLLNSSTGRCFAAFMPATATERLIDAEFAQTLRGTEAGSGAKGASSSLSRQRYREILEESQQKGLARVTGDLIPGINSLSAPVFGPTGALTLVFTALGPAASFDASWNGQPALALRTTASALSARLGATPQTENELALRR